ncbi:hypothetical protein ACFSTE_00595 [Aquimarina hainanensis]|uniref:Uncharacterized protein n=1 Tax=Aquimarina hainanensis TaxID=1578017 RepID=A0ABW5N1D3_9FLAO|nr:hypothetical protein [Aquimarina sp. TRL1]QKX04573.1 hypothetical protein HN014_06485 [Aquimarina sp. TRL1]
MIAIFKNLFGNQSIASATAYPKIYTRCKKLVEDYTEEQLIRMYGKEKTAFIQNNPEEWV